MNSPRYLCPGEAHPISRAVHLGRLAAFYPGCRQCPHRYDTGTLSPKQVEQLAETSPRGEPRSLFHDEGAGGVYLNDLAPAAARDIAAAFGVAVRLPVGSQAPGPNPSVVLADDGRPLTVELVAAVGEGLRWSGCDVIDIGPATAACLAFAVHHLQTDGALLVGNPSNEPRIVGLQFWAAGPRPLSTGGSLEPIAERYRAGVDRPVRVEGRLRRFQADVPYLAGLAEHYHALRPLRVVVESASKPLLDGLKKLAATVACKVIPSRAAQSDLAEQVRADAAHFAVCVDGDGETCRVLDQTGRIVPPERLLPALSLLQTPMTGGSPQTVVLEEGTSPAVVRRLEQLGFGVVGGGVRRADMAAAMQRVGAMLGGGVSGRFWHVESGVPLPDGLMTITQLLKLLSRTDEPLSTVLDREAVPE